MSLPVYAGAPAAALVFAAVAFSALSCSQALHVFSRYAHVHGSAGRLEVAYEAAIAVHFVLMAALALSPVYRADPYMLELAVADVPIAVLLWLDAAAAGLGVAWLLAGARARGAERMGGSVRARTAVEVVLLLAATPAGLVLAGERALCTVLACLVYGTFRAVLAFADDRARGATALQRFSLVKALDKLPEGVLCAGAGGRALYANDVMRGCLAALGLPTDLADTREIWPRLCALQGRDPLAVPAPRLRIDVSDHETRLFTCEDIEIGGASCQCIIAYDITEDVQVQRQMAEANRRLEQAGAELRASLADLQGSVDAQAVLQMRSHVHDVIGQRVSILHRYLEDGDVSDATVERIGELLASMLDELARDIHVESAITLDAVVDAFSVIGVEYEVAGELPRDARRAQLYVRVIREASTNAVRHGQATRIGVRMDEDILEVENDGAVPDGGIVEGSGMRGMRAAAAEIGASFSVITSPRFTIRVAR